MEIKHQKTKTLQIKENGRSSDFVTPNFILSCNAKCTYCYTYRFGRNKVYINDNTDQILSKVLIHSSSLKSKLSNQTDDKYWTYDIACDTDIAYHWKDYDWDKVFKFFTLTPDIKATFATKYVNNALLQYGNEKLRIRFSLMPQHMADVVEKFTTKIDKRIEAIDRFIEAGWDVHINFSPIIYTDTWEKDYVHLFNEINNKVKNKDKVKCEVIFLTHNQNLHNINLEKELIEAESLLWKPELQEKKVSQYGGDNVRYEHKFKAELIQKFMNIHKEHLNWCKIRYIF